MHVLWGDGTIYIERDFASVVNGRNSVSEQTNVTGNLELWTIRINRTTLELFRGTNITPIGSSSISTVLPSVNLCDIIYHSEMDLYAFVFYSSAFTDTQIKQMFWFFKSQFGDWHLSDIMKYDKRYNPFYRSSILCD